MKTYNRNYQESRRDFERICRFFIHHNDFLEDHSTWFLQRFIDWRFGLYPSRVAGARFWEKNCRIWFDDFDDIVGLLISEDGEGDFFILTAPGFRILFGEILSWKEEHWLSDSHIPFSELSGYQERERKFLTEKGYHIHKEYQTCEFDLASLELSGPVPPAGFQIHQMKTDSDYRLQRCLRALAFNGKKLSEKEIDRELEFNGNTKAAPTYSAYTDLCVRNEEGLFVSGCEGLLNPWNCTAEVERVCTHPDFRRLGLGRLVIQECLFRLKELSYRKAFITGYSEKAILLYESMGASRIIKNHMFKKE